MSPASLAVSSRVLPLSGSVHHRRRSGGWSGGREGLHAQQRGEGQGRDHGVHERPVHRRRRSVHFCHHRALPRHRDPRKRLYMEPQRGPRCPGLQEGRPHTTEGSYIRLHDRKNGQERTRNKELEKESANAEENEQDPASAGGEPTHGGSYLILPKWLRDTKKEECFFNPKPMSRKKEDDNRCFSWCILRALHFNGIKDPATGQFYPRSATVREGCANQFPNGARADGEYGGPGGRHPARQNRPHPPS